MIEWISIPAGIASGALAGFGTAWLGRPAAAAAAEESKLRNARRRKVVADGRALVLQATQEQWNPQQVAADPRFAELRPNLSADMRARFDVPVNTSTRIRIYDNRFTGKPFGYSTLRDAVDALERAWDL